MQAKWGSHGDYELIALSPSTVQECLDLTIESFNLSEIYKVPVILLTDGIIGHMREKTVIPEYDDLDLKWRTIPTKPKDEFLPYFDSGSGIPETADFGNGYHTYITGLTHKDTGYPTTDNQPDHDRLIRRLCDKIRLNRHKIVRVQKDYDGKSKDSIGIVSYGVSSRTVFYVVKQLRKEGKKVNHLRIITNWPFPEDEVRELSEMSRQILVPELNLGQVYHSVKEAAYNYCEIIHLGKIGGVMHTPDEIIQAIKV